MNKEFFPFYTNSLCPECKTIIPATVFEKNGKAIIEKKCPEHGEFEDVYWEDAEMLKKAAAFSFDDDLDENAFITERPTCPFSCGLCSIHHGKTGLLNIVLTNRCDLSCWYCFFYAPKAGYIYEPEIKTIKEMVRKAKAQNQPIGLKAIQLTGGEPTLRDDLVDIVKMIKKEGIEHIQLNTNGIRIAEEPKLADKLRKAGVNLVYLSFDGVDKKSNPKNFDFIQQILENCRKTWLNIVLVPTIIKGTNDDQLGKIVNFALQNLDIIRGINFQPISLVGKLTDKEIDKFRITIPGAIKNLEKQLNGQITKNDFYTVPVVAPISKLIEILTGNPQFKLTTHFACGMATYVFKDNEKIIPITRFVDVEKFLDLVKKTIEELKYERINKLNLLRNIFNLRKVINKKAAPKDIKISHILFNIFIKHNYESLAEFHLKALFIGFMHFQDLYNYDIERLKRCQVHYASPDGRLIPFCSFNVLPEIYRDKIQREYGQPIEEWEKATGKRLKDDLKRKVKPVN